MDTGVSVVNVAPEAVDSFVMVTEDGVVFPDVGAVTGDATFIVEMSHVDAVTLVIPKADALLDNAIFALVMSLLDEVLDNEASAVVMPHVVLEDTSDVVILREVVVPEDIFDVVMPHEVVVLEDTFDVEMPHVITALEDTFDVVKTHGVAVQDISGACWEFFTTSAEGRS